MELSNVSYFNKKANQIFIFRSVSVAFCYCNKNTMTKSELWKSLFSLVVQEGELVRPGDVWQQASGSVRLATLLPMCRKQRQ